ncbi:MAG: hypothetical protein JNK11_00110 [Alphaproteobacteria bacterium]|nr:hypothetical protein [Alphaproteobacteria bacterium]
MQPPPQQDLAATSADSEARAAGARAWRRWLAMRRGIGAALLFLLLLLGAALMPQRARGQPVSLQPPERKPPVGDSVEGRFAVGGWAGTLQTTPKGDRFVACQATGALAGGASAGIRLDRSGDIAVTISNPGWRLRVGDLLPPPPEVPAEGQAAAAGSPPAGARQPDPRGIEPTGYVVSPGRVVMQLGSSARLVEAVFGQGWIAVPLPSGAVEFRLPDARRVLGALRSCAQAALAKEAESGSARAAAASSRSVCRPPVPSGAAAPAVADEIVLASQDPIIDRAALRGMLDAAGLGRADVLPANIVRSEYPGAAHAWLIDGAIGYALAWSRARLPLDKIGPQTFKPEDFACRGSLTVTPHARRQGSLSSLAQMIAGCDGFIGSTVHFMTVVERRSVVAAFVHCADATRTDDAMKADDALARLLLQGLDGWAPPGAPGK